MRKLTALVEEVAAEVWTVNEPDGVEEWICFERSSRWVCVLLSKAAPDAGELYCKNCNVAISQCPPWKHIGAYAETNQACTNPQPPDATDKEQGCPIVSETRKPAPSERGAKKDRDEIDRAFAKAESAIFNVELCADCGYPKEDSRFHFEAPGTNWGAALHCFRAPASPALPQSNPHEVSHETERCASRFHDLRCVLSAGHELRHRDRWDISAVWWGDKEASRKSYTQPELNTLLDAMARSVVEEAAKLCSVAEEVGRCNPPCHAIDRDKILAMLTPEKLTQLREAVQRI